ncbi:MAG: GNAT family N-acetyltransferase [Syntrophotaleaceae bacterium]
MRITEEHCAKNLAPPSRKAPAPESGFAGFIDPLDERWAFMLKKTLHDFYHLPAYVSLAAEHETGQPAAFYAEQGDSSMLIPLLIRSLPPHLQAPRHWCDLASPYGYPSPLYCPGADHISPDYFLREFGRSAADIDAVSGFFRLHPLIGLPWDSLDRQGKLVYHGETVYIDLVMSDRDIWRNTRENHRDNIQRLREEGFEAVMDDWSRWSDFITLYHETMNRLKASSCYCFSDSYFDEFRFALGFRLHLCTVIAPDGKVAASGLVTVMDGLVQFHLAATASPFLEKAPSKLMFDSVRQWAQNRGERYLHLGGGVGGKKDSLFRFKAGFSKKRAEFHTFRMIFNQQRYDQLVMKCQQSDAEKAFGNDYFPAYRKKEEPFLATPLSRGSQSSRESSSG